MWGLVEKIKLTDSTGNGDLGLTWNEFTNGEEEESDWKGKPVFISGGVKRRACERTHRLAIPIR